MRQAHGVLPDPVIKDPASAGELIYFTFADGLEPAQLEALIGNLYASVTDACGGAPAQLSATIGWGARLFQRLPGPPPAGISALPVPDGAARLDADLVVYVMSREEARLADLRRKLCQLGAGTITAVVTHRGYQRLDGRELGGFHDGLRNAQVNREQVVFVDRDTAPEEPLATDGGTYMTTMRIVQNLDAWETLAVEDQQRIIGRRKTDGSRLDLAEGTPPDQEGEIGAEMPADSHVAKSGPRGPSRDRVQIFRRGLPFTDITPTGSCESGLQFVGFHASNDQMATVLNEWMGNPDFPDAGTNTDALFRDGLATITTFGSFFVPAAHDDIPGAGFFHPVDDDDRCLGHLVVRKTLQDSAGNPMRSERGGFRFQLLTEAGVQIGSEFDTDSAGRATSPDVPRGATYILRETFARPGFAPNADLPVSVERRRQVVEVINRLQAEQPPPGYR